MRHIFIILLLTTCLVNLNGQVFTAFLSGQQEVDPVVTTAQGMIKATLEGSQLIVEGEFNGLIGEVNTQIAGGVHIHSGLPGQDGGVEIVLIPSLSADRKGGIFDSSQNSFTLTPDQITKLRERGLYVNIHTTRFHSGEIRGQLLPQSEFILQAILTGHQEVPAVFTKGYGIVLLEVNGNELTVSGSFEGLMSAFDPNIAGGAHIHLGEVGRNGNVAVFLTPDLISSRNGVFNPTKNSFTISNDVRQALLERRAYVNIHTQSFPSGEIRGQITSQSNIIFKASLSGANEKPFVDTKGFGDVMLELETSTSTLTVFGSFNDLVGSVATEIAGGAHIHLGFPGQNGPVEFILNPKLGINAREGVFEPENNRFTLSGISVNDLLNRSFYINIHTDKHHTGELRGQILPLAQYHFNSYFGGSQEFPPVVSLGNGAAKIEYVKGKINVVGSFADLGSPFASEIAGGAHLHFGLPGENGGIALHLRATLQEDNTKGVFLPTENEFMIDEEIEASLINRGLYINIHTARFPSGEIRGQVLQDAHAYYQSSLSGSQEVPAVLTKGRGAVMMERVGNIVRPVGTFSGLQGSFDVNIAGGAHIHQGIAGSNGPIFSGISPEVSADGKSGRFSPEVGIILTDEAYGLILERLFYINIHTSDFPSGELRGQINSQNISLFRSHLASLNEIHPVESTGRGQVSIELNNAGSISLSGAFENLESPIASHIAGGAHIHVGLPGTNGPVAFALQVESASNEAGMFLASKNVFDLSEEQLLALVNRATYINLHTENSPNGEIRGQINGESNYVFTANLSGTQEVPSIVSTGYGQIKAEWNGNSIMVVGSASNLLGELDTSIAGGAHIHLGLPGQNGPVAYVLQPGNSSVDDSDIQFAFADNIFNLSDGHIDQLISRGMYINIHTNLFHSGELRGQLLREALVYYQTNLFGSHEVPSVLTGALGAAQLEWNGSQLEVVGAFSGLEGDFAINIAGGAHIHNGLPGENGSIAAMLVVELDEDNRGGLFLPEFNKIITDDSIVQKLRSRELYFNIHSTAYNSGEIRGQIFSNATALFRGFMSGGNEVPSIFSSGTGVVQAEYRADNSIVYYGSFSDLIGAVDENIAGGIHIHNGVAGRNGGILFHLDFLGQDDNKGGIIPLQRKELLDEMDIKQIFNRGTYINIHTSHVATGEIRGQLSGESQYEFTGIFSPLQEVLPASSTGNGAIKAEWSGNTLILSGAFQNLTSDLDPNIAGGAHLHIALPGSNGPVANLISPNLSVESGNNNALFLPLENRIVLDNQTVDNIKQRLGYLNIHTTGFPAGEIRAQLLGEAQNYYMAILAGSHEAPAVRTQANGVVLFEKYNTSLKAVGSFDDLTGMFDSSIAGGAHIHKGLAGSNGPISAMLNTKISSTGSSGEFLLSENEFMLVDSFLLNREYYINIHTTSFPSGELRGQLMPIVIGAFYANLNGENEVPYIESPADGAVLIEWNGQFLTATGSFDGLLGEVDINIAGGAHLHMGGPAENGPVNLLLNPTLNIPATSGQFDWVNNQIIVEEDLLETLYSGGLYVNIHTTNFHTGELRGQVLPQINFFPTDDSRIIDPVNGSTILVSGDESQPIEISWSSAMDRDELAYLWEVGFSPDLDSSIFKINTGLSTQLTLNFGMLIDLLEANGIMERDTILLYHRAIASDGSLQTTGPISSVTIIRDIETSSTQRNREVAIKVFPSLIESNTSIQVELYSTLEGDGSIQLLDINGRVVNNQKVFYQSGMSKFNLTIPDLNPGLYFVLVTTYDGSVHLNKVIKQ